jgi:hypothetical protein
MKTVFALTGGRSGTLFLSSVLRRNVRDCLVFHEPYLDRGNPAMFGRAIYEHETGDLEAVRRRLRKKQERVSRGAPRSYVETSHAFLKSYWDLATEFFPDLLVVHLVRDPLAVARSEANREAWLDAWHIPFRRYRAGDGKDYLTWALTGLEPIFRTFEGNGLSRFQWYVVQWIEIENRAMRFLDRFGKASSCFTLDCPGDLNDPARLRALIDFLGLSPSRDEMLVAGARNRNPGRPTVLGRTEEEEFRQVIALLPREHLEIFTREPYARMPWAHRLRGGV